jgi:hypothetical protein
VVAEAESVVVAAGKLGSVLKNRFLGTELGSAQRTIVTEGKAHKRELFQSGVRHDRQ